MPLFGELVGRYLDRALHSADSTQLFTTVRRNDAINEGVQWFVEQTECIVRESTVTCSTGTYEYNLLSSAVMGSTDFMRLASRGVEYRITDSNEKVRVLSGDEFPRRDYQWRNRHQPGWNPAASTIEATPDGYYLRDDDGAHYIGLTYRPKIGSSESAKLIIPYVPHMPEITSYDEEPFTINGATRTDLRPFHQGLVHYAAYALEPLRGDQEASDKQFQLALSYVERFKAGTRNKVGGMLTFARNYLREAGGRGGDDGDPRISIQWP